MLGVRVGKGVKNRTRRRNGWRVEKRGTGFRIHPKLIAVETRLHFRLLIEICELEFLVHTGPETWPRPAAAHSSRRELELVYPDLAKAGLHIDRWCEVF
jgi:hypothetical protein